MASLEDEEDLIEIYPEGDPRTPKPPGRLRRIGGGIAAGARRVLGAVAGVFAFVLTLGALGIKKAREAVTKFKNRPKKPKTVTRKHMGLRHAFYGAAILAGALMGPGVYYMTQPNEIVTTRVTGKVEADTDKEYPGRKWVIHSKEGTFDTYGVSGGNSIQVGCTYEFNVKGARLDFWPPSYTRSVQSFKHVPTPGCPGG